jgi:hypothetical protein
MKHLMGRLGGLRRTALQTLVVVMLGCSGATGPDESTGNCRLGPFPFVPTPGCQSPISPQCPRPRPASARTSTGFKTCGYRAGQPPCTPAAVPPACNVTESPTILLFIIGTNPTNPLVCTSQVRLFVNTTPAHEMFQPGGAEAQWSAQEFEQDGDNCRAAGPPIEGSAAVAGPCCETAIDVRFPRSQFTFRIALQTDWQ